LREFTIKETAGIFIMSPDGERMADEQALAGTMAAGRAAAYLSQGAVRPRSAAVSIDSRLCRGCGDCTAVCPFIEMRERSTGVAYAYVDPALCLGCGACISHCPTGAITQPHQSTEQVMSALEALLRADAAVLEPTSVEAA
jgi:heterodisulfide reductase subunit A-like polyferredoxin